jgi:hypothetical protein
MFGRRLAKAAAKGKGRREADRAQGTEGVADNRS